MENLAKYIYFYAVVPSVILLIVYLYSLYRNPKNAKEIENRANIIFDDEPLEPVEENDRPM